MKKRITSIQNKSLQHVKTQREEEVDTKNYILNNMVMNTC